MCENCNWEESLIAINNALDNLEELPEEALDFAISVEDKLMSIKTWVTRHEHCTDKQWSAVENMARGIDKWM